METLERVEKAISFAAQGEKSGADFHMPSAPLSLSFPRLFQPVSYSHLWT